MLCCDIVATYINTHDKRIVIIRKTTKQKIIIDKSKCFMEATIKKNAINRSISPIL